MPTCLACRGAGAFYAKKNGYNVYRCDACRSLFVFPMPSIAEIAAVYDTAEYFFGGSAHGGYANYDEDKEPMRKTFLNILGLLKGYAGGTQTLLDVGAATGYFVALARQNGWDASGIELSSHAVEIAHKKNIPVTQGALVSAALGGSYDVVTLWDVIEHVPDPDQNLDVVFRLLKPGGVAAFITPKADAWWARLMGPRWHLLVPPEHLACFTTSAMRIMLARHGLDVVGVRSVAKRFTLPYILHTAANWLSVPMLRSAANAAKKWPWAGTAAIPLNFHDNMLVIAQKNRS
ncbi:MAG: class I SAM-dependent methyltransferase [bacterium]|nr:class I SAM-dependent methyltransferase [bacterium]